MSPSRHLNLNPLSCALLVALAGGAFAAPVDPAEQAARELDGVQVTATRRSESVQAIPTAVSIIDREDLKRDRASTPVDFLYRTPGVYVQHTTPGQGIPIVRGLKGSEVLHLVDGFRLNNAFFRNAPSQYFALVDAQNIDRMEVVRGPASTLYGSDAMGGVVQVFTPEADFASDADWDYGLQTRSIYSTAELQKTTRIAGSAATSTLALQLGYTYNSFGNVDVGEGGFRLPFSSYTARGGDFKLRWAVTEGQELMLSYQQMEQPKTPRHDVLLRGFGTRPDNAVFFFEPNDRRFTHLRYTFSEGFVGFDNAEFHIGHQVMNDDRTTRATGSNNLDRETGKSTLSGFTFSANRALGDNHYLTVGADLYFDRVNSALYRTNIVTGVQSRPTSRYPDESFQRALGFFATDDWRVSDKLDIVVGLRWSDQTTNLPPADRGVGVNVSFSDFSGQLGLRYALSDNLNLVSNLGRGFRAPNVFDLGTLGPRPSNRFNIANPNLGAERVTTMDLGFKYAQDGWQAELFGFKSRYRDRIVSVLTGERDSANRQIVQSQNVGRSDLHGFELGLKVQWNEQLESWLNASYVFGKDNNNGVETKGDRVPPLAGTLGLRYAFSPQLSIEGYTLFADNQDRLSPRDATDARINPNGTPGHATANLALAWQAERWFARLAFENITDMSYREHGSGIDSAGKNLILTLEREW